MNMSTAKIDTGALYLVFVRMRIGTNPEESQLLYSPELIECL